VPGGGAAQEIAAHVAVLTIPPCTGFHGEITEARDHWVRGPRGTLAQRLVGELMQLMLARETADRKAKGVSALATRASVASPGVAMWTRPFLVMDSHTGGPNALSPSRAEPRCASAPRAITWLADGGQDQRRCTRYAIA
jgi:hypothetical protein